MKRELMVGFVLSLFVSFVIVSAGTCEDDQTIMRLYSEENSHVSLWSEGVADYEVEICFDKIFGSVYTGANPHECTGENRVLSLSDISNAHTSSTTDEVYSHEICYGKLQCVYDSSDNDECSNDGKIVARMYSGYNSHVSTASDTDYPVKVCCKASEAYWANMNGDRITEAELGDTVKLVLTSTSDLHDFEIFEEDGGIIGFFTGGDNQIKTVAGSVVDGNLIATWTITQEDLGETYDHDNFKFIVNGEISEELEISEDRDDSPTSIEILSPECGSYFDEGTNVLIDIRITDEDDIITGTVSISGEAVESFTDGRITFNRVFDLSGNYQVIVDAVSNRGTRVRAISNIMILDKEGGSYVNGEYVAACIMKPEDFSNIDGKVVEFDASTTRGIRITDGVIDELIPDESDMFSWYWRFFPENRVAEFIDSVDSLAYRFTTEFSVAGDNSATLRVEI